MVRSFRVFPWIPWPYKSTGIAPDLSASVVVRSKACQTSRFGQIDVDNRQVLLSTASAEEIPESCKGRMAHFKIPRHIWFVDEFPMTVTGKLQKFRMREIAIEKMELAHTQNGETERV